jgi:predicted metal-dependent hydrolase
MRTRNDRREILRERVTYWAARLRVKPQIVRIQHMTRKWGSCSSGGIVTLAEDLAREESGFQDFVIAHELLHLRVRNHGRVFDALMTVHVPGWRKYDGFRKTCAAKGL